MRPTIKSYAREIKLRWPEYDVKVERGHCNTDRKPKGFRYITHRGKGRWGTELRVYYRGEMILHHNNAETYRRTDEVRIWINSHASGMLAGTGRKKTFCKICDALHERGKPCPRCASRRR